MPHASPSKRAKGAKLSSIEPGSLGLCFHLPTERDARAVSGFSGRNGCACADCEVVIEAASKSDRHSIGAVKAAKAEAKRKSLILLDTRDHGDGSCASDTEAGCPSQIKHFVLEAADLALKSICREVQLAHVDRIGWIDTRGHIGDAPLVIARSDRDSVGTACRATAAKDDRAIIAGSDIDIAANYEGIVGGNRVVVTERPRIVARDHIAETNCARLTALSLVFEADCRALGAGNSSKAYCSSVITVDVAE